MWYKYFENFDILFGTTNASVLIEAYANNGLWKFIDVFCIVYLDNMLIYSNTYEEHVIYVRQVLACLCEYSLSYNHEKKISISPQGSSLVLSFYLKVYL